MFKALRKKIRQLLFKLRVWFWAAVFSKYFDHCQFRLLYSPIELHFEWRSTNEEIFAVRIVFNRLWLWFHIADESYREFQLSTNYQGEFLDSNGFLEDEIPF